MAPVFQSSRIALSLFTVLNSVLNAQLIGSASFLKKIGGIPSGLLDFVSSVSSRIDLINRFETEKLVTNPSVTSLVCLVEILHGCEYKDWKSSFKRFAFCCMVLASKMPNLKTAGMSAFLFIDLKCLKRNFVFRDEKSLYWYSDLSRLASSSSSFSISDSFFSIWGRLCLIKSPLRLDTLEQVWCVTRIPNR